MTEFTNLIRNILSKHGLLKKEYVDLITDRKGMNTYYQAFTSPRTSPNNYEFYEILGDATLNKSIVWYLSRRFPQLNCPNQVKVIARLKINLVSRNVFSEFAAKLGFTPFINASPEELQVRKKILLEDIFEAFFGVTESLIDSKIKMGAGYQIVYNIIKSLFDEIDISLKYEDLFDAKTRLKELFDTFSNVLGELKYYANKNSDSNIIFTVSVYRISPEGQKIRLSTAIGEKVEAEQEASKIALAFLNSQGYVKKMPPEYEGFCKF